MPTWSGILAEIQAEVAQGNPSAFDVVRRKYLAALAAHTKRNAILYATKWTQPGDHDPNLTSITEEDVQGLMEVVHGLPGKNLDLILHSPGGSAEAAEAIVHYLRAKFDHIRVIVPHAAMSAATLVACAANEIVMGKQSSLGPVDPQYILSDQFGRIQAVPAQAILDQFNRAKQECKDPHLLGAWAPMLAQYGPALLVQCENALKLAENLAAEWIRTWMLGATKGKKVAIKARSIAKALRDHKRFKSHARHISRDQARAIGLLVTDLEVDQTFQDLVLSVYHATTLAFDNPAGAVKIIENQLGRAFVKLHRTVQIPVQMMPVPMMPQPVPPSPQVPPAAQTPTVSQLRVEQGPNTGLNAIVGRWPGSETDREVERALRELS